MIDWAALGEVVWVAFAASLTLVVAFTGGVLLVAPQGPGVARRVSGVALLVVCAALVAFGVYVLFDK